MGQSDALAELARQVRGDTISFLAATKEEWLTWSPPGTSNHILWHAGHAAWVLDLLGVELLTGKSELPEGWGEKFAEGSNPRNVTYWPSREELSALLESQLGRILELLKAIPDEVLARTPESVGHEYTTLGWITHGLHDEAKHCGEMYLLWKLCRQREQAEGE